MKKIKTRFRITVVIILLLQGLLAKAQYEWAPIGAEWYYCLPNEIYDPTYSYEKYISEKDTLIEGKSCRVVKSNFHTEYFYQDGYKVYYWQDDKFNLIYDFAAKINDTIACGFKLYSNSPEAKILDVNCIVKNIDSIDIDGFIVKTFETVFIPVEGYDLAWGSSHWYVEKFGNVFEFFEALTGPEPSVPSSTFLRCYADNDISHTEPMWEYRDLPCDYMLNIEEEFVNEIATIYPNPCSDIVRVELLKQANISKTEISIFDFFGREIQTLQAGCTTEQIDMSALKSGVYYIKIADLKQNKSQVIKTIKE